MGNYRIYGMNDVAELLCKNCKYFITVYEKYDMMGAPAYREISECIKQLLPSDSLCIYHDIYEEVWEKYDTDEEYSLDEIERLLKN